MRGERCEVRGERCEVKGERRHLRGREEGTLFYAGEDAHVPGLSARNMRKIGTTN